MVKIQAAYNFPCNTSYAFTLLSLYDQSLGEMQAAGICFKFAKNFVGQDSFFLLFR